MPTFRVTTRQSIGHARAIPAGAYITITIPGSKTRPDSDEIIRAFEQKYGVGGIDAGQLCAINYDIIG